MNSKQAAVRLPYEIFSKIFHLVRGPTLTYTPACEDRENWLVNIQHIHQWMRIARVCRRWRAVALSVPSLWTSIVIADSLKYDILCGDGPYPDFFLHRSRSHPLHVFIDRCSAAQTQKSLHRVLRHLHRIRVLCILSTSGFDEGHFELLQAPAPKLEVVVLNTSLNTVEQTLRGSGSGASASLWPFNFIIPNLRSLSVGLLNELRSVNCSHLRQLHIDHGGRFQDNYYFLRLFGTLQHAVRLQDLCFSNATFATLDELITRDCRARIPQLQRLVLHRVDGISSLLIMLELPDFINLIVRGSPKKYDPFLSDAYLPGSLTTLALSFNDRVYRLHGSGHSAAIHVEDALPETPGVGLPPSGYSIALVDIQELLVQDTRVEPTTYTEKKLPIDEIVQDIIYYARHSLRKVVLCTPRPSLFVQCLRAALRFDNYGLSLDQTPSAVLELNIFDPLPADYSDTIAALKATGDAEVRAISVRVSQTQRPGLRARYRDSGGPHAWKDLETLVRDGVLADATWGGALRSDPWDLVTKPPVCDVGTAEAWQWPELSPR